MMRIIHTLLAMVLIVVIAGIFVGYGVYQHFSTDLPDIQQLQTYQPRIVSRVQAGDGRLLAEYATEKRVFVPVSAMPKYLIDAVLAAEDREFYSHGGINPEAVVRAALQNLLHAGSGRRQIGASTITQQVAKNFLLGDEYSYTRKIKEMILATRIDQTLSKQRILELYLNEIYFGHQAYGIAEAALTYFNKSLDQLTIPECAFLASLPKGPSTYDPIRHYQRALERRNYVLDGMASIGAISQAQADSYKTTPIVLAKRSDGATYDAPYFTEEVRRELIGRFGLKTVYEGGLSVRTSLDPVLQSYATTALRDGLISYDRKHGYRGPVTHVEIGDSWQQALKPVTLPAGAAPWKLAVVREVDASEAKLGLADGSLGVLPLSQMAWARKPLPDQRVGAPPRRVSDVLKRGDVVLVEAVAEAAPAAKKAKKVVKRGKAAEKEAEATAEPAAVSKVQTYGLRQIPAVSGAIVVMDPHTGRVFAVTGGYSYDISQFNRATQAYRQTGSAIKPIVYLAALDNGMTPSTLILDDPVAIEQGPGLPLWRPGNFDSSDDNLGPQTLRYAIEHSINTMTVRMAATIGINKIIPYVENMGILDKMPPEYSYVLGAGETTPLRLTTAYAMLVNGGKKVVPSLIDRVQNANGITIFKHDTRPCPRCGDYNWPAAGEVPELPDDRPQVIDPATAFQMVNILRGVVERGTAAHAVGSLHLTLAGKTGTTNDAKDAWFVGFSPDLVAGVYVGFDQPKTLGPKAQGADISAPIFAQFMQAALAGKDVGDFRIPPGVVMVRVNPHTGQLAEGDGPSILEAFKPGTEPLPADEIGQPQVIAGAQGIEPVTGNMSLTDLPADGSANQPPSVGVDPTSQPQQPKVIGGFLPPGMEPTGMPAQTDEPPASPMAPLPSPMGASPMGPQPASAITPPSPGATPLPPAPGQAAVPLTGNAPPSAMRTTPRPAPSAGPASGTGGLY
jgi:penicillin-binding protein 1A